MAIRNPNANESIKNYDELQSDYVNDLESGIGNEIDKIGNGITIPMTVVQVTGEVDLIIHGNIIYLQGRYTNTASVQRVCNIPTQYAPKVSFQKPTSVGEIQVNTGGNVIHSGANGTRGFVISWSIANK